VTQQALVEASVDVYDFAKHAASEADANIRSQVADDGATLSARAYQDGKGVVYEYILAIRRDVAAGQISQWRAAT
jgi:hypothetical protein